MKKAMCFLLALVLLLPLSAGYSSADAPEESEFYSDIYTTDPYCEAVTYLYHQGIMFGTGDGIFSPNATLTRAEVVTVIWRMAGRPAPEGTTTYFSDCPSTAYYYDAVRWASSSDVGIAYGTSSHTFSPTLTVTQQDTLTFLYRFICYCGYITDSSDYENDFDDSDLIYKSSFSSYAKRPVGWAYTEEEEEGIFSDNTLIGTANCLRKDLAEYAFALYQGYQEKYGLVVAHSSDASRFLANGRGMQMVCIHYGATNTVLKDNIPRSQFYLDMGNAFGEAKPLDICYLCCTSHGNNTGMLLFTGSNNDRYLTPSYLQEQISRFKGMFVVLLSACDSGVFIPGSGNRKSAPDHLSDDDGGFDPDAFISDFLLPTRSNDLTYINRTKLLCSSEKNQTSYPNTNEYSYAPFYWCVGCGYWLDQYPSESFGTMQADANQDEKVTLDELFEFSSVQVSYAVYPNVQNIVVYPTNDDFIIFE